MSIEKNGLSGLLVGNPGIRRSDLIKKAGLTPKELDNLLKKGFKGYNLFTQRRENDNSYHLVSEPKLPVAENKIWKVLYCPNGKPYLWVQFPDTDWKKITLIPFSDLQWGSEECNEEQIRQSVEWIGQQENVFIFINGDLLDNALASSVGGSVYQNKLKPREQVLTMIELLRPIAHKILWAIPGNHEERTVKLADLDPLEWICSVLGIPYFNEPVFVNILWKGNRFNFYCFHGVSGSRTIGGKLNAATKPINWTEFIMFIIMGHVHDPMVNPITRRCILREYDDDGKLKELRVVDRDQYVIICPAWLDFWNSYGHRQAYAPPSEGKIMCYLMADGSYQVSQ
jgi:hypothetical protein